MNKKWVLLYKRRFDKAASADKIISTLLKNRGITKREAKEFIDIPSPLDIGAELVDIKKDLLKKAVRLITKLGEAKEKIIVFGDYDADGLCATAILWETLWTKGMDVMPYIPDREKDGYGISVKAIDKVFKKYPDTKLIITVDNGIVANKAVAYAKKLGIKVIITDHHVPSDSLPIADAIVHTTELSGSGVAWFLAREFGYSSQELVALGTVADLMPLTDANRSFVKFGLKQLSRTRRVGLVALKEKAGILDKELTPYDASFILVPRLNASGRVGEAMDSLRLLCTKGQTRAKELASHLNEVNKKRQEMMVTSFKHAKKEMSSDGQKLIFAIDKSYHQGIIGLVAGKLTEEFYRPSIVIWKGKFFSKGSARSINGCNIVELIRGVRELLVDVGGHPMAAGFTIETSKIEKFVKKINKIAQKVIVKEDLTPKVKVDFEIDFSLVNKDFYQLIQKLAPFGFGNSEPTFLLKKMRVVRRQAIGKNEAHLKIWVDNPETSIVERVPAEAIGFGWGSWKDKIIAGDLIDLVFNIDLNVWNGKETIQLKIKDLKRSEEVIK